MNCSLEVSLRKYNLKQVKAYYWNNNVPMKVNQIYLYQSRQTLKCTVTSEISERD